jgi:hypothetical protein
MNRDASDEELDNARQEMVFCFGQIKDLVIVICIKVQLSSPGNRKQCRQPLF